ncbi:hypothetical protein ACFLU6_15610, partial [Acidobacteriota bacterium]
PVTVLALGKRAPEGEGEEGPETARGPRAERDGQPPIGMGPGGRGHGERRRPDFSSMTPEQIEQIKERMRNRGMSEKDIEERLSRVKKRSSQDKGTSTKEQHEDR